MTLDVALVSMAEEAARLWPELAIAPATFVEYVTARASSLESVGRLESRDLYLACACVQGDPRAILAFEQEYLARVGAFVRRVDPAPEFAEEVKSRLREKLLLPTADRAPKLTEYLGAGSLAAWLRVVALRTALNVKREDQAKLKPKAVPAEFLHAAQRDPEAELSYSRYAEEFREAFYATLRTLPSEHRLALKLHALDGLNIAEIGKLLQVHRATVARWIAQSREAIVERTKRVLERRLKMSGTELAGVVALLKSHLDLSISRCLAESTDSEN